VLNCQSVLMKCPLHCRCFQTQSPLLSSPIFTIIFSLA
jgi:hypothetical protein